MNKLKLVAFVVAMLGCVTLSAKGLRVLIVKTSPEMHCNGCETKIKDNIRFVSGVKKIDTDLENKTVTITYDTDKTDSKKIVEAFKAIKYEASVVSDIELKPLKKLNKAQKVDGQSCAPAQQ